jgi:hypothetical protein
MGSGRPDDRPCAEFSADAPSGCVHEPLIPPWLKRDHDPGRRGIGFRGATWRSRKVTAAGVVTTLGGMAGMPGSINGTGSAARFDPPISLIQSSGREV